MTRPQQPAARARWDVRLEAIGLALASLRDASEAVNGAAGTYQFHMSTVSRITRIPETTLRTMADAAFTSIRVPGYVVGWGDNWFHLAPGEPGK